jgi:hypothetical protein
MPIISALGGQMQEDLKFQASLGHTVRPYNTQKTPTRMADQLNI